MRELFSNTRSRWLYQIWFFLGYLGAEYYMFFSPEGGIFGWLSYDISANIIQKIILTLACIVAFAHKLYTMCEAGVNIKAMQDILGHADAETTMQIYAEATKDLKKSELINFDEYFAKQKEAQSGI